MSSIRLHSITDFALGAVLAGVFLLSASFRVSAQITSENHRTLKQQLKLHPKADSNGDGVLTFAEYQTFQKLQGPRKQPNGKPAGPISTLLHTGELLLTDFEENNLGRMRQWGWLIEGDSFSRDLAHGTGLMKLRTVTHHGKYLLTSYGGSDATTGRFVSPTFEIELKFIQFQVSGGDHPHRACVNLIVDDRVVRTITGRNTDRFETVAFDVTALEGRKARVEILDSHRGFWGRVNVDHVVQTDRTSAKRIISKAPANYGSISANVLTVNHHLKGPISLSENRLQVGKQWVLMEDVLQIICQNDRVKPEAQSALRLVDGQIWHGQVLELKDDKLGFQSSSLGRRDVPLSEIAVIQFKGTMRRGGDTVTLYRDQGEPIPGKVIWIREKDVAMDCVLGIVRIPRQTIQSLVLAKARSEWDSSLDEVGLVDGNLLRGKLTSKIDHLILNQGTLGSLNLNWSQVSYVRRAGERVVWLDQIQGKIVERVGPVLAPPEPEVIPSQSGEYLRAIRMMPRMVTQYKLPMLRRRTPRNSTVQEKRTFRASLAPVPGSRANVIVRIRQGSEKLWEKELESNSDPIAVAVELQDAKDLTIEVDFAGGVAFPCGVDWCDAVVHTSLK